MAVSFGRQALIQQLEANSAKAQYLKQYWAFLSPVPNDSEGQATKAQASGVEAEKPVTRWR